jgi:hypothetical protein
MPMTSRSNVFGSQGSLRNLAQTQSAVGDVWAQARSSSLGSQRGTHVGAVSLPAAINETLEDFEGWFHPTLLSTIARQRVSFY